MTENLGYAETSTGLWTVDADEKAEGIPKKRRLEPLSLSGLQIPSCFKGYRVPPELRRFLPRVAEAFKTNDLSLLKDFILKDPMLLDVEYALHDKEVVAWCVWFLLAKLPSNIKERLVHVLEIVISGPSSMVIAMPTDETYVENIVVRVLHSNNGEVIRQACFALSYSLRCNRPHVRVSFVGDILDQLLELVHIQRRDPKSISSVVDAISVIATLGNNGIDMRDKIVKSELSDSWLVGLLKENENQDIMGDSRWIVASIVSKKCDGDLLDHIKNKLLPHICGLLYDMAFDGDLLFVGSCVIYKIAKWLSSDDIRLLVELGCLKFLFYVCDFDHEGPSVVALKAIKIILRAGDTGEFVDGSWPCWIDDVFDDEVRVKKNEYADMIDGYEPGWEALFFEDFQSYYDASLLIDGFHLVKEYRPHLCEFRTL